MVMITVNLFPVAVAVPEEIATGSSRGAFD